MQFGSDEFYESVIEDSPTGKSFVQQRDAWKEGQDFSFTANFYATEDTTQDDDLEDDGSDEEGEDVVDTDLAEDGSNARSIIDVEAA